MNDYKPGDLLPNGTYYLGMLPDGTHSAMEKTKIKPDTWDNLNKKYVLPNQYEGLMLHELYQQKPELFDLGSHTVIWLSVPIGANDARVQRLDTGDQFSYYRVYVYSSCPVRRFKSFSDLIISDKETVLSALTFCAQTPENVSKPDVMSPEEFAHWVSNHNLIYGGMSNSGYLNAEEFIEVCNQRDASIRAQTIDKTLKLAASMAEQQSDTIELANYYGNLIRALKTGGSHD